MKPTGGELHAYFETELFRAEPDELALEEPVLGEDCSNWFKTRLSSAAEMGKPVQEDWGWALPVTASGRSLWLMLQKWHTTELGWHVWIEPRGLIGHFWRTRWTGAAFRLRDTIDQLLQSETRVRSLRWVTKPEELEHR